MNTAVEKLRTTPPLSMTDNNNRALHSMVACAQVALEGLDTLGLNVLSVAVQGAKPVIEIMNTAASGKFTAFNSTKWQIHSGFCPVKKRPFSQFFLEYRECLVTWIKWG